MTTPRINWSNAWRATRGGRLLPKLRSLKIAAVSTRPIGLTYKGIAGTRDRAKAALWAASAALFIVVPPIA